MRRRCPAREVQGRGAFGRLMSPALADGREGNTVSSVVAPADSSQVAWFEGRWLGPAYGFCWAPRGTSRPGPPSRSRVWRLARIRRPAVRFLGRWPGAAAITASRPVRCRSPRSATRASVPAHPQGRAAGPRPTRRVSPSVSAESACRFTTTYFADADGPAPARVSSGGRTPAVPAPRRNLARAVVAARRSHRLAGHPLTASDWPPGRMPLR